MTKLIVALRNFANAPKKWEQQWTSRANDIFPLAILGTRAVGLQALIEA